METNKLQVATQVHMNLQQDINEWEKDAWVYQKLSSQNSKKLKFFLWKRGNADDSKVQCHGKFACIELKFYQALTFQIHLIVD